MDAIFGWRDFRNEIVWRRTGSHNAADRFGPIHDVILFYAKSDYRHVVRFSPYLNGYVEGYFRGRMIEGDIESKNFTAQERGMVLAESRGADLIPPQRGGIGQFHQS